MRNEKLKMKNNPGIVYLIGAGPGDPDLITVKGRKLLEAADAVVYDALVNPLLISMLPSSKKKIFVGKRGGKPSPKQTEINRILVREGRNGKKVARLKGGDPLVFGRGSEEMEYLVEKGVPFVVVPGITSSIAAPTCAGIPVTHRSVSRSFAVVTGHLQAGETIDALELPQADTIVFLMAMANLSALIEKLIAAGKFTKRTPAALIRNGSHPDQKVITGTLGNIASKKEKYGIIPPAAFVVGETVRFAKTLSWWKTPPLAGIRVAVLRTNEQSRELVDTLLEKGATVLPCPIIKIQPRIKDLKKIRKRFLSRFTMVIVTSPNGAGLFMEHLLENGGDARFLAGKKVYAMGSGTAAVLLKYGIRVDALPEKFVAEGITGMLPEDLSGESILIPRAAVAREILPDTLKKRGAEVVILPVYDTVKNNTNDSTINDGDFVLFTSSSTVDHFYRSEEHSQRSIIPVCIGDITAKTLRKYYRKKCAIAENATIPALVKALEAAVQMQKKRK